MKTPEEIKKGLMCCGMMKARDNPCKQCPYAEECKEGIDDDLMADAYAYIEKLEETIALMKIQMRGDCGVCKHNAYSDACLNCLLLPDKPMWEYEGLPQLPGKDERHEKPV